MRAKELESIKVQRRSVARSSDNEFDSLNGKANGNDFDYSSGGGLEHISGANPGHQRDVSTSVTHELKSNDLGLARATVDEPKVTTIKFKKRKQQGYHSCNN